MQVLSNTNMFIVNHSNIQDRFDAEFYSPFYALEGVRPFVPLKRLATSIIHPPEYPREFSSEGVQLIRSQNVRPLGINMDENPVFFSQEFLENRHTMRPEIGDILVVRSGVNAGDTAVVEENYSHVIIGADTLLCKCNSEIYSKFLQVYFFTGLGKRQMIRHITGATNKHLNSNNLGKVLIPLLNLSEQDNCINIYENAIKIKQQKEEEAKALLATIDDYLISELEIKLPNSNNNLDDRIFTSSFSNLSGIRFDPNYHSKMQYLLKQKCKYEIKNLKDLILGTPQYGANEEAINGDRNKDIRYIRITDIDELGNLKNESWKTASNIDEKYLLNKDDVLFARSGSVGRCYIHKEISHKSIFAGYLIRFLLNQKMINPNYLFYYCHSSIYKHWVNAIYRPAVQANINSEEYKSLPIPLPDIKIQNEIVQKINEIRQQAKQLQQEANDVLEQAKIQVEEKILKETI